MIDLKSFTKASFGQTVCQFLLASCDDMIRKVNKDYIIWISEIKIILYWELTDTFSTSVNREAELFPALVKQDLFSLLLTAKYVSLIKYQISSSEMIEVTHNIILSWYKPSNIICDNVARHFVYDTSQSLSNWRKNTHKKTKSRNFVFIFSVIWYYIHKYNTMGKVWYVSY